MQNEPESPAPLGRKRRVARFGLLIAIIACLFGAWREYGFRKAVREIKGAGFVWTYDDPIEIVRNDWRAIFLSDTWTVESRDLHIHGTPWAAIADHREAIERLRPRRLVIASCTGPGCMDALKNLRSLRELSVVFCEDLETVAGIEGLVDLERLTLGGNLALENVDAINCLSKLRVVRLEVCPNLKREAIAALEAALPKAVIQHDFGRSLGPNRL